MKISIIGLGYIGSASLICLAKLGHTIIGYDKDKMKVTRLQAGKLPINEKNLRREFERAKISRPVATNNLEEAILKSKVAIVTVSAPLKEDSSVDLSALKSVCTKIAAQIKKKRSPYYIIIRSTVPPGTCQKLISQIEAISGKKNGRGFSLVFNPEFIREGSAIEDYLNPPYIILGAQQPEHTRVIRKVFENISAEKIYSSIELAELLKYACNSFHALKVAFANEISTICQRLDVDADELMRIFTLDKKLNISSYYLIPGFAFGGSCLPKDLKALNHLSELNQTELPVLQSIEKSNEMLINKAVRLIKAERNKKIGFLGITFKAGTSDLRGSPALKVMLELNGNRKIKFFDPNISNLELENANGEISKKTLGLLKNTRVDSAKELIQSSQIIVVATREKSFLPYLRKETHKKIFDLANFGTLKNKKNYVALNW